MKYLVQIAALTLCAPTLAAAEIPVPSGQIVTFHEVIWEQDGVQNTYRFRYIAPDISRDGGLVSFDQAAPDLHYLCEKSALPNLRDQNRDVDRIVISISDVIVEFGKANPEATQYIDAFSVEGIRCIEDAF